MYIVLTHRSFRQHFNNGRVPTRNGVLLWVENFSGQQQQQNESQRGGRDPYEPLKTLK